MGTPTPSKADALALVRNPTSTTVTVSVAAVVRDMHPNTAYALIARGEWTEGLVRNGRHLRVATGWLRELLHIEVELPPADEPEQPEPDYTPNDPPPLRELAPEQIPRAVMKPSRKRAVPAGAR